MRTRVKRQPSDPAHTQVQTEGRSTMILYLVVCVNISRHNFANIVESLSLNGFGGLCPIFGSGHRLECAQAGANALERSIFHMSQIYLNGPSTGRSISAEEFVTGAGLRFGPVSPTGCGCGEKPPAGSACPDEPCGQDDCCQPMICCCRPAPAPAPKPPQVDEGCCCKQSFRAALGLLCDQQISGLLDFGAAAFLTGTYTAGAALTGGKPSDTGKPEPRGEGDARTPCRPDPPAPVNPNAPSDNLGKLTGSFLRFAPCTCDLLDIDAELYTASGKSRGFTANQVSLCQLDAVVIQGAAAAAKGDLFAGEEAARNFRCLCDRLAQRLNPAGDICTQDCNCSCACDGRDCCCAAGLLSTLAQNNLSRRVSLTAGLLVLRNATLLGTVGNVLVLCNDADNRLYFVCVNSVQFVG